MVRRAILMTHFLLKRSLWWSILYNKMSLVIQKGGFLTGPCAYSNKRLSSSFLYSFIFRRTMKMIRMRKCAYCFHMHKVLLCMVMPAVWQHIYAQAMRSLSSAILCRLTQKRNQSTDSTGGSTVSECRSSKWSWTGTRLFHLTLTSCNLSKQCRSWSNAALCCVWIGSTLFATAPNVPVQVLQIILYQQHSHVRATRIARV